MSTTNLSKSSFQKLIPLHSDKLVEKLNSSTNNSFLLFSPLLLHIISKTKDKKANEISLRKDERYGKGLFNFNERN